MCSRERRFILTISEPTGRFTILYQDDNYVAIHKPSGIMVHRTAASGERAVVLQKLRNQIGGNIFPLHRLDRPTSGVLIFGKSPAAAGALAGAFREHRVAKLYLALVRGYVDEAGTIDKPLREGPGAPERSSLTRFTRLATIELPIRVNRYPSTRYSLVAAQPQTGRFHQIRKHFASIRHPLLGDSAHGDGRHNRFFREHFQIHRLHLVALKLGFFHPYQKKWLEVTTEPDAELLRLYEIFGWDWQALSAALPKYTSNAG